ncbi:four-carbon acid sugar kinase family protein [Jeotgalibacillus soli]|uniref:Hydroxyacid dehydrogenase n=1 Tax=Jeotgalibacillus soli TaxID=889306 RepID=A0A0C2VSQ9_9BACL|nr:four-carbon acid sugar kinase family protein [Jeotgalibacillus soli]KIL51962.1 hypothetical protein KP78_03320 [Jeotgalibacillus soli]
MTTLHCIADVTSAYPRIDSNEIKKKWAEIRPSFKHKIIVLDDDPTGVQTVHNVSVYTDWSEETIEKGFLEDNDIFFILTNSRAYSARETETIHHDIALRAEKISEKQNRPYLIISRGDSTLRGHYPLETEVMRDTIESAGKTSFDGEILMPFFKEGGRLTVDNIHYVLQDDILMPAGETEFSKDRTFGYKSSHLGEWIEEKTNGHFKKDSVTSISLESIRRLDIQKIVDQLMQVSQFGKVVVNALEEEDIMIFSIALIQAIQKGKHFMFRTAATFTKVIGNISSRPILTRSELIEKDIDTGGLIVVGSHVQKTTEQLNALQSLSSIHFIEFDCHLALHKNAFQQEIHRVQAEAEEMVSKGVTTAIYTKRERLDLGDGMKEEELKLSVEISEAVTSIVRNFTVRPNYVIAKGGITSSDVGTKGLQVKRATVLGQIAPGIPVWKTGEESTFPHIPYVIFPGNVGAVTTLKEVVMLLEK